MKKSSFLALAVAPILLGAPLALQAQSVATDPVGFVKTTLEPGFTGVGLNMLKPAAFSAKVDGVDGNTVTLSGELTLNAGAQYYLEVADGAMEGDRIDVASATGAVVTLDLSAPHNTVATNAIPVGSRVIIREHNVLADITSALGDALHSGDDVGDTDQILLFEGGNFRTFAYFDGDWYDASNFEVVNSKVIPPATGILFNRNGSGAIDHVALGEVRANDIVIPLAAGYQLVTTGFPVDRSPAELVLTTEFFTAGEDIPDADQILVMTGGNFRTYALLDDNEWYDAANFDVVTHTDLFQANGSVLLRVQEDDANFRVNRPY